MGQTSPYCVWLWASSSAFSLKPSWQVGQKKRLGGTSASIPDQSTRGCSLVTQVGYLNMFSDFKFLRCVVTKHRSIGAEDHPHATPLGLTVGRAERLHIPLAFLVVIPLAFLVVRGRRRMLGTSRWNSIWLDGFRALGNRAIVPSSNPR